MSTASGARTLLTVTLFLALAGDLLLRAFPWGINFSIATLLLFAGIVLLARWLQDALPREAWPILSFGVVTAGCLAWRDSPDLAALNILATLGAAALVVARKRDGELARMTFAGHLSQMFFQAIHLTAGFGFLLLSDIRPKGDGPHDSRWGRAWLGIALAVPALLVFGSLLTSADATFEYVIEEVLRIDFWRLMGHAAVIGLLSWAVGGVLRGRFFAAELTPPADIRPKGLSLGITEVAIVLGALDLLFAAFVAVQIPYFFGGHGTVLGTASLTYAEYARRGFFELITVALLSLPLLLAAEWLLRTEDVREMRIFRALAILMIALLGVMLASGVHRLLLYVEAYALTTARLNAAAILVWVGSTLVLFCATVLRGKRSLLPYSMAVSAFVVLIAFNALNPDALVARVNLARMATDGKFDPRYTLTLSADALPELLKALPAMEERTRSDLATRLLLQYAGDPSGQDLRTWNASRAEARALVQERESFLRSCVLPCPAPKEGPH